MIRVRVADEQDLPQIASMVADFVRGHKAESHPRDPELLRQAYFGADPVAELVVAERDGELVGMAEWARVYDMFWSKLGGRAEWLYVRPDARNRGVSVALLATVCARLRERGGRYLTGSANPDTRSLYARCAGASGYITEDFHLSASAFHQLADLEGKPPREVVRGLPTPDRNYVEVDAPGSP